MAILQEEFCNQDVDNLGYRMLVACIMLNQTSNKNVRKIIYSFFDRWPTPNSVIESSEEEIREHIKPLGFYNTRSKRLKRFALEYLTKPFVKISELHGIGKYAEDSYEIFIKGNRNVNPTDKILQRYLAGEFINQ